MQHTCHILFQICISFFLLLNEKEDILKNVNNQIINLGFFYTMEVNGYRQMFDY